VTGFAHRCDAEKRGSFHRKLPLDVAKPFCLRMTDSSVSEDEGDGTGYVPARDGFGRRSSDGVELCATEFAATGALRREQGLRCDG
jgi:hypothetical protein